MTSQAARMAVHGVHPKNYVATVDVGAVQVIAQMNGIPARTSNRAAVVDFVGPIKKRPDVR